MTIPSIPEILIGSGKIVRRYLVDADRALPEADDTLHAIAAAIRERPNERITMAAEIPARVSYGLRWLGHDGPEVAAVCFWGLADEDRPYWVGLPVPDPLGGVMAGLAEALAGPVPSLAREIEETHPLLVGFYLRSPSEEEGRTAGELGALIAQRVPGAWEVPA